MPRSKNSQRCYVVLSKDKKYRYGAFPLTEEGLLAAKAYVKKIEKKYKEKFFIKEV
tara:strand:+ start:531 stop:698 length:168 start_codon:yes stop_codon:yes gene_type:complete